MNVLIDHLHWGHEHQSSPVSSVSVFQAFSLWFATTCWNLSIFPSTDTLNVPLVGHNCGVWTSGHRLRVRIKKFLAVRYYNHHLSAVSSHINVDLMWPVIYPDASNVTVCVPSIGQSLIDRSSSIGWRKCLSAIVSPAPLERDRWFIHFLSRPPVCDPLCASPTGESLWL